MSEILAFDAPKHRASIIKVIGVGGGGSNAVTHMHRQGIKGVDFIICNTDAQALESSPIPNKVQLGSKGLGAGSVPDVGRAAAEENIQDIREILETNTKMLFITAGMGGGTGTGATPIIAETAREMDILTVAIVTIPFNFEGRKRRLQAEKGIEELKKHVDTLLIISNEKLREIHGNLKLSEAFGRADDILTTAAKGIAEIITVTGYINVDFEDVKTVMKNSGTAIMGSAVAEGNDRARTAVREALSSPLLNDNKITGASDILLYISSGKEEITFDEVTEITDYIQEEAGLNAEVIWGNGFEEELGDKISITLIATGFKSPDEIDETTFNREKKKKVYTLEDKLSEDPAEKLAQEKDLNGDKGKESQEIDEITLIKKDKPQDSGEDSKEKRREKDDEMLLFDQPVNEDSREPEKKPFEENNEPRNTISSHTAKNKNLRIKHTIGDFSGKGKAEDNAAGMQKEVMDKKSDDRIKKLRELSMNFDKPGDNYEELEKVPAYVRKNIQLKKVITSSETNISRYTLGVDKDDEAQIGNNNDIPYIHNKPD